MALHRPAEFNRSHIPAFLADEEPRRYVCVYPFVRSYEWYLLPDEERRDMLEEHGMMARPYPDVRANTVASFALGDYEWMLAFEADELHRIVDLMRELRASRARRHVREEVPVLHRRPQADRRTGRGPALTAPPHGRVQRPSESRPAPAPRCLAGRAPAFERPRRRARTPSSAPENCRTPLVVSGHVPHRCVRRSASPSHRCRGRARRVDAAAPQGGRPSRLR